MRRGFQHAAGLLAEWSPLRQQVHTAAAVPGGTSVALFKETLQITNQVWKPSPSSDFPPVAFLKKGDAVVLLSFATDPCGNLWLAMHADKQPHQQQRVSFLSTQHQLTQRKGPDISLLEPALQKQWDHAANAHLGNIIIKPSMHTEAWWTCDQCPDGYMHNWSTAVYNRSDGNGCPQCRGRKVCKHNSLATKAPIVAAQWDYEVNDGTPDAVVAGSGQAAHWLCDACGHKWRARITKRAGYNTGCPLCAKVIMGKQRIKHPTFAECQHALLAEWDHRRNAAQGNFPGNTKLRSGKQILWLCTKCPAGHTHSWSARPRTRTGKNKTGCPFCASRAACRCNSLQALYPDTAAEWDHARNKGQPCDYPAGSTYLAWWSSCGRGSWQQTIHSRTHAVYQRTARPQRVESRQRSAS